MADNSDQFDYSAFTGTSKAEAIPVPVVHNRHSSEQASTRPENPAFGSAAPTGWLTAETGDETTSAKPSGPPLAWLATAIVCAIAASALAAIFGSDAAVAGVCWLLGGPVAIALLAIFTYQDTARQADVFYSRVTWIPVAYGATIVLIFMAISASALQLALWAGRL